jgi:hypothetical protein
MVQASDRIACVAVVGAITDKRQTIHSWGLGSAKQFMAFPDVVLAEGDAASVMLYRYRCDGEFCGDTWHASLGDAQGQAEYEYGEHSDLGCRSRRMELMLISMRSHLPRKAVMPKHSKLESDRSWRYNYYYASQNHSP